jgi:hypothetical protein
MYLGFLDDPCLLLGRHLRFLRQLAARYALGHPPFLEALEGRLPQVYELDGGRDKVHELVAAGAVEDLSGAGSDSVDDGNPTRLDLLGDLEGSAVGRALGAESKVFDARKRDRGFLLEVEACKRKRGFSE